MDKIISVNIKDLRKREKYTQKELAELLGVAQTTIANYENGLREPDAEMLQKIADVFNVSVDFLIGREDFCPAIDKRDNLLKEALLNDKENLFMIYLNHLLEGHSTAAKNIIIQLYELGLPIDFIYFDIFEKALNEVGRLWAIGKIDVWKEHFISEITLDSMREIKAREKRKNRKAYTVLGLTAGPEMHHIGLRMVLDMLEIEGFNTVYLGTNVPAQSLVKAIESEKPNIIAISVTMEYHIESAKYLISAIKDNFKDNPPKIVVGGGAFNNNPELWKNTGADNLSTSVEDIKNLLKDLAS